MRALRRARKPARAAAGPIRELRAHRTHPEDRSRATRACSRAAPSHRQPVSNQTPKCACKHTKLDPRARRSQAQAGIAKEGSAVALRGHFRRAWHARRTFFWVRARNSRSLKTMSTAPQREALVRIGVPANARGCRVTSAGWPWVVSWADGGVLARGRFESARSLGKSRSREAPVKASKSPCCAWQLRGRTSGMQRCASVEDSAPVRCTVGKGLKN